MKKILMIAADFPPCLSAGVQRTLHFAENLLNNGWQPLILTANSRVYRRLDDGISVSNAIAKNVTRAFALDASVHLAINGKYFDFLEDPDKIASWYHHGWRAGLSMIKQHKPDVIWSTYPVSTAHRIALKLKQKTALPWIADFRDPLHCHFDDQSKVRRKAKEIDIETLMQADHAVFSTKRIRAVYSRIYPSVEQSKLHVIENGFDSELFHDVAQQEGARNERFVLLYSGYLYDQGRNPEPLFQALGELKAEGYVNNNNFVLRFRGSGDGELYRASIEQLGIGEIVEFLPSISFRESVEEMFAADGLLVFQGHIFDNQIPGKVYEYIASKKPILGFVGEAGATAELLSTLPNAYSVPEFDIKSAVSALKQIMSNPGEALMDTSKYSRRSKAKELMDLLESI